MEQIGLIRVKPERTYIGVRQLRRLPYTIATIANLVASLACISFLLKISFFFLAGLRFFYRGGIMVSSHAIYASVTTGGRQLSFL